MVSAIKRVDCVCEMKFVYHLNSGILVPGGFGKRGAEGKIAAAEWGRKMKKPYLGMNSKLQTGFLATVI